MTLATFTGTKEARAHAWADLPDDELRRRAAQAANDRDFDQLWSLTEAYLHLYSRPGGKISPNTLRFYRLGLRKLLEHWGDQNLLRPSRDAAGRFLLDLTASGLKESSVKALLAAARVVYKALVWSRATPANPFEHVKAPRDPVPAEEKRRPYSGQDIDRLLSVATIEERALVLIGAHAGLRASEALSLRWKDVDASQGYLRVHSGKGGKPRTVRLGVTLLGVLRDLRASRGDSDGLVLPYSGSTARRRMTDLCERAGVEPRGLHSLRHYAGTRLARELSLEAAQRHLGHANIQTTQVYAKWNSGALDTVVGSW